MRQIATLSVIILLPFVLKAQNLKGKVYDATSTLKNIKVLNETQKAFTVTNIKGEFTIAAKVNDTIIFESLFYHSKSVILKPIHFESTSVFELKKIINTLEEVEILSESKQPIFKEKTYNEALQNLIKEDIKRHPELYTSSNSNYGIDFVYLFKKLTTLFKRKNKKGEIIQPIGYEDLKKLIETDKLINSKLITQDLNIPQQHLFLFLEFCAAKQMSHQLLEDTKRINLLEELVINSKLFLDILKEYQTSETLKN